MKDIELNPIDKNQRKMLQIGVVLILILFLAVYFLFFRKESKSVIGNNSITLENSKLQVFNDTYTFDGYPDKILIHYPYFMLVQGNKPLTIVYNLETKKKEKEIREVLLDYYEGNIIYNKRESYFNDKNLDEYCDSAFIKNETEVLCITKQNQNAYDNMLMSINPDKPNLSKRVYQSKNLLTTVSVIDNKLYVGEIDTKTKQNYVSINGEPIHVENIVSLIYPLKGKPYFASFPSALNKGNESYYIIEESKGRKISDNEIIFYKD